MPIKQKIILVLGPSGVGKSTSCNAIPAQMQNCVSGALDILASQLAVSEDLISSEDIGALRTLLNTRKDRTKDEYFLDYGLKAIAKFVSDNKDKHCIIDVGAGFQCAKSALTLSREYPTIALTCDANAAYARFRKYRRQDLSFSVFRGKEFTPHRCDVYKSCCCIIDTTNHAQEETITALINIIQEITGDVS